MAKSKKKTTKNHQRNNQAHVKKSLNNHDKPISTKNMIIIIAVITLLIICCCTIKLIEYENTYYLCVRSFVHPNNGDTVVFRHTYNVHDYYIMTDYNRDVIIDDKMTVWGIALFDFSCN